MKGPLFLLILLFLLNYSHCLSSSQETINYFYEQLSQEYHSRNDKYIFLIQWYHKKGIYDSKVHFNYVDKHNTIQSEILRDKVFKVDDVNMFVTSFVLFGLLEAQQLGTVNISEHKVSQSLEALNDFQDKNVQKGIPRYVFWEQSLINGTWCATPKNLLNAVKALPAFPKPVAQLLALVGWGILGIAKFYTKVFIIPPDTDDSSVNLALLGFLKEVNSPHYNFWNSLNNKKTQFYYNHVLKYAYRPFTKGYPPNPYANEIDPRTYFIIRQFLDFKKQQAGDQEPSLILPTTWLINNDQIVKGIMEMPFSVNNVDATVSANFLFGLIYQILSGEIELKDDELKKMMFDSVEFLQFTIKQLITKRPDLILVYYPSRYDFYWFVARNVQLLKRYHERLPEDLISIQNRLESLMKDIAIPRILKEVKKEKDNWYWTEFLGNFADKSRNDDALFSTSLALNALIDTWSTRTGKHIEYDKDLPQQVRQTINHGIQYLQAHANGNKMNAFFSGSLKVKKTTYPYMYPANVHRNNGTNVDPQNSTIQQAIYNMDYLIKGYVEKDVYEEKYLKQKWFGQNVPTQYKSFNAGYGLLFPFWSSDAITEVMAITALSKHMKLNS